MRVPFGSPSTSRNAEDGDKAGDVTQPGPGSGSAPPGLARSFRAAWVRAVDPSTAIGELLPTRLARASVEVLSVSGASVSVINDDVRVPLGASDETAGYAERLEFTHGQGPCLDAARAKRPVVACPADIGRRWPVFATEFFARTPYRALLSLPLPFTPVVFGALDLFLTDPAQLNSISVADAVMVTAEIVDALEVGHGGTDPNDLGASSGTRAPVWSKNPALRRRTCVWIASGMLMGHFDISAADALALMRAYGFSHASVVDDIADQLIDGTLNLDQFGP